MYIRDVDQAVHTELACTFAVWHLELVQSLQDIVSTAVSRNELEQYVYAKFHCAHVPTLMLRCRH